MSLAGNSWSLQNKLNLLQSNYESKSLELSETLIRAHDTSVNKKILERLVDDLIEDNTILDDEIKKLKSRPTSVGTVIVTQPGTVEIIQGDFPSEFFYILESGMPVARHKYKDNTFTAETYDITVDITIITTEDKKGNKRTYVQSFLESSGDDESYPVATEADFIHAVYKPTLMWQDPHLNIGASVGIPTFEPRVSLGISTSSIGRNTNDNSVRFMNIKGEVGRSLALGVDLVGVNLSNITNIPLIQDTWIWGGLTAEVLPDAGQVTATLSIGSTL